MSEAHREGYSGSRLPSFSQPSKMPDGQISNTRKFNYWGLYASKTIGSLRPERNLYLCYNSHVAQ